MIKKLLFLLVPLHVFSAETVEMRSFPQRQSFTADSAGLIEWTVNAGDAHEMHVLAQKLRSGEDDGIARDEYAALALHTIAAALEDKTSKGPKGRINRKLAEYLCDPKSTIFVTDMAMRKRYAAVHNAQADALLENTRDIAFDVAHAPLVVLARDTDKIRDPYYYESYLGYELTKCPTDCRLRRLSAIFLAHWRYPDHYQPLTHIAGQLSPGLHLENRLLRDNHALAAQVFLQAIPRAPLMPDGKKRVDTYGRRGGLWFQLSTVYSRQGKKADQKHALEQALECSGWCTEEIVELNRLIKEAA